MPVVLTVAIPVAELLQVPPVIPEEVSVEFPPEQTLAKPEMLPALAEAFTVTVVVAERPDMLYEITEVPADTPITMPVLLPMVAIDVLLLLHEPPHVALPKDVVAPAQTMPYPVIGVDKATGVPYIFIFCGM